MSWITQDAIWKCNWGMFASALARSQASLQNINLLLFYSDVWLSLVTTSRNHFRGGRGPEKSSNSATPHFIKKAGTWQVPGSAPDPELFAKSQCLPFLWKSNIIHIVITWSRRPPVKAPPHGLYLPLREILLLLWRERVASALVVY